MEAYGRQLRADAALPSARDATDMDLQDHAATLVADVAQSMMVLGGSAETGPRLLRDGSRIQRLVAELHAEQRRRLGWSEAELRLDYEVLREEADRCVRAHVPPGEGRRGGGRHRDAAPAADAADQHPGVPRGRGGLLKRIVPRPCTRRVLPGSVSHGVNGVNGGTVRLFR